MIGSNFKVEDPSLQERAYRVKNKTYTSESRSPFTPAEVNNLKDRNNFFVIVNYKNPEETDFFYLEKTTGQMPEFVVHVGFMIEERMTRVIHTMVERCRVIRNDTSIILETKLEIFFDVFSDINDEFDLIIVY